MPPLLLFNRKWNIASDDFVYLSLVELTLLVSLIIIYIFYADISETPFKCNMEPFYRIIYFGLGISIFSSIVLTISLLCLSAQGTIMDASARCGVSYCIYCKIVVLIDEIVFCCFGLSLRYKSQRIIGQCNLMIVQIYEIIFVSLLLCLFIYILMFWIYFDKLGNLVTFQRVLVSSSLSETVATIKKNHFWRERLRCFLCMCKPSYEERNALDDVAEVFAVFDKESNLVWSDYQAGFYLMMAEDKMLDCLNGCSLKLDTKSGEIILNSADQDCDCDLKNNEINESVLFQRNFFSKLITSAFSFFNEKSKKSNQSNNAIYVSTVENNDVERNHARFPSISKEHSTIFEDVSLSQAYLLFKNQDSKASRTANWRDLRFVYYFATVAKASYGWPLNLLFRDKSDSCPRLYGDVFCKSSFSCCSSKCLCSDKDVISHRKHQIIYPKGKLCAYHIKAILNKTHLTKDNLICVSFYNKDFYSPFFVAISHDMQVIILSIRGSFSMKDILTDLNLNLVDFEEDYLVGCAAHSGMVKTAYKLKYTLLNSNIITNLIKKYKDYRLIITGHSLGAGVAVILTCLLYNNHPNVKCYAYGIPMGSVNRTMADFCQEFVLTVVNGFDWVCRLSLNSLAMTKNRLTDCLTKCQKPKYKLTAFMLCLLETDTKKNAWNILNVFKRNGNSEEDFSTKVKLPGQIINIVNLKTLEDNQKSKSFFAPVVTCSEQFDCLSIRCDMFTDHFPTSYIDRLYNILKTNNIFSVKCHHYMEHYWPKDDPMDDIILPFLEFLAADVIQGVRDSKSAVFRDTGVTSFKVAEVITTL